MGKKTMTGVLLIGLAVIMCVTVGVNDVRAQEAESYSVAVLPFTGTGELQDVSQEAHLLVNAYLSVKEDLVVVEREDLDKVLGEWELSETEMVSTQDAVQIAKLIGTQVIIIGRVFAVENTLMIVTKTIGVETSRVYGQKEEISLSVPYVPAVEALSEQIYTTIMEKGDTLLAGEDVPKPEDSSLKDLAAEKALPTIAVKISEQHQGRAGVKSTAQAAMEEALIDVGFPLMDTSRAREKVEVLIEGKASSEFLASRENFVSCEARVELKAVNQETGTVIAVEKETAKSVDLSEAVAGKNAIEQAVNSIAPRLIKKILNAI